MAVTFDSIFYCVLSRDCAYQVEKNFQNCLVCNECVTFDPFGMYAVHSERHHIVTFMFICLSVWWQGAMFSCH